MKEAIPGKQNNFVPYLLLLIGFFILFFLTKNFYNDYMLQRETKLSQLSEISSKSQELKLLNTLKVDLNDPTSEAVQSIRGFSGDITPSELMDYLYSYAQEVNLGSERMIIKSLGLSLDETTDFGFQKAQINLEALFSSEKTMLNFLDTMIDPESSYRFYIEDFTYPLGNSSQTIQVTVPLVFYYAQ